MDTKFFGKDGFTWWKGVVEDRNDPIFLGRARVRIFGWHTDDKTQLPTEDLPWALPSLPIDNGKNPVGLKEGDWCWGFFLDGADAQKPIVIGYIPGINEDPANPDLGFYDPTGPEELAAGNVPRPPRMTNTTIEEPVLTKSSFLRSIAKLSPPPEIKTGLIRLTDAAFAGKRVLTLAELPGAITRAADNLVSAANGVQDTITQEITEQIKQASSFLTEKIGELTDLIKVDISESGLLESASRFGNSATLPGTNLAFGELRDTFDITKSKFDVDKNGEFNEDDAKLLIEQAVSDGGFFDGYVEVAPQVEMSSYPLADMLNEPSSSRLSRNEKIEETIVALKKQKLIPIEGAGFSGNTMGAAEEAPTSFVEPPTPYAAQYPYNHVYESESGHVLEVDDTPNAERMHRYHRSGTFNEIHPDGVEVNRVVNSQYNIVYGDYFNSTGLTFHVDAKKGIKMKSGMGFNIQTSDSLNQQVGSDLNTTVGANVNAHIGGNRGERVAGNSTEITEGNRVESISGSDWISVAEGVYINTAGGPVKIKASGKIQLISDDSIDLIAPTVNVQTSTTSSFSGLGLEVMGKVNAVSMSAPTMSSYQNTCVVGSAIATFKTTLLSSDISNSNVYNGTLLGAYSPASVVPVVPLDVPPIILPPVLIPALPIDTSSTDDANSESIEDLLKNNMDSSSGSPKYGFFIPNGVTGDVYKPVSDSSGNLVTLSASGPNHELREAIPTGVLETVLIKYEDPSGSITEWQVVRPVHVPGELIDQPSSTGMFEDGVRHLARWSKPGSEYPKQMFWVVNGRPMLILDSAERHQCKFGPYNDKIA